MTAEDGKQRLTDVANTEQLLRLIQSIPSPKAEPFKLWLAAVGKERLDEIADPEKAIQRGIDTYRKKGYSEEWIGTRMRTIEARKDLTHEWQRGGVSDPRDFGTLTNIMTKTWSDMSVPEYKQHKGLKKESLRDNMSKVELALNYLAEITAADISEEENPDSIGKHKEIAQRGGSVSRDARSSYEKQTGRSAITSQNASNLKQLPHQKGQ
jgi:hypothetical protein